MRRHAPFVVLAGCFFLSGLAGLIYETLWTQQFAVVFGTTELALATVLAAYMAGLAGGAAAAARLAPRAHRPVRLYAVLELGIALSALAVPRAIRWTGRLQSAVLGGEDLATAGGSAATLTVYVLTSFAILLVPTALMGATLPLLARHAVRRHSQIGHRIGILYTVNAAGAALGTWCTAFVLLPHLDLDGSVWVAAGINLLVFLLATSLDGARGEEPPPPPHSADATSNSRASPLGPMPWILPMVLVSGAVSFTLEIQWTRLLTLVLGGSAYAFATMLASFLVGIALGAALGARLASDRRRALVGFSGSLAVAAGLTLGAFSMCSFLPTMARALGAEAGSGHGFVAMAALCALTLLPAAIAFGATFPFAVTALARDADDASRSTGRVFAWNTAGAICGSLAAGFLLLPALGFAATAAAAAATCLLLATAAIWPLLPRRPGLSLTRTQAAALGLASTLAAGLFLWQPDEPETLLRHRVLGNRATDDAEERPPRESDSPPETSPGFSGTIRHLGVGRSATVVLFEQRRQWRLVSNGLPESAIQPSWGRPGWGVVERYLSLLPVAARPGTGSMLVIGLGAGVTVEDVPSTVREIHVVELEPEVVQANRSVAELRRKDPLADPRLHLVLDDARGTLQRTRRTFDAIVSQPSHPWTAGASHLFTREFFALARERLAPSGTFVQWMGLPFVDPELLRSLVATLSDVFPFVELYQPQGEALLFLASMEPLDVEASLGEALDADPRPWALVGIKTPADMMAARVLDADGSRLFASRGVVSTDGRNLLRIRSPRILGGESLAATGVDPLLGPWDPEANGLRARRGGLYLLRRIAASGQLRRARRLARLLDDTVQRSTAQGLVHLAAGRPGPARAALREALALDRTSNAARGGLLRLHREAIEAGRYPADLAALGTLSDAESLLVSGWRMAGTARWRELAEAEDSLARLNPRHPLGREAIRLRARWRVGVSTPQEPAPACDALSLIEPLLAPRAQVRDLVLRAEAVTATGDHLASLATLGEARRTATGVSPELRDRAIALLRTLGSELRADETPASIDAERWRRELLRKWQQPPRSAPESAAAPEVPSAP